MLAPPARARVHVRQLLRDSGLRYGTPTRPVAASDATHAPEERLFIAVLETFAALALDVAFLVGAPPGPRAAQLLILFATWTDQMRAAQALALAAREGQAAPRRLISRVESAVEGRAMSLGGDPAYGLVLHNGAVYVDAQFLGRQAVDTFLSMTFSKARAQRRRRAASHKKALLTEVLTALACAERPPRSPARRAILQQLEGLGLPPGIARSLRQRVKRAFERRPALRPLLRVVRSAGARHFLIEQTLLAALVDGRRSARELAFVAELAVLLGISHAEVRQVEVQLAEFYAQNRSVLDVFTVSAEAGRMGDALVDSMQSALEKNFQRLMREIRQTGELSALLTRAARGQTLSAEEKRKVRAGLVDVAKAIPALAIFAAPGGALLLIALAKVLPFNILPSAFQDEVPPPDSNQ